MNWLDMFIGPASGGATACNFTIAEAACDIPDSIVHIFTFAQLALVLACY